SQRIKQRGLSRVGIPDECDCGYRNRLAALALLGPNAPNVFDLLFDVANAPVDFSAIGFQLSFARTSGTDAAAELHHFQTAPGQTRQQIFQLRKFDLQLSFTGAGVAREDVEDELRAINHPGTDNLLDISLLGRR